MMRRILTALLLIALPAWFLPACLLMGIRDYGRAELRGVPRALRFVLHGGPRYRPFGPRGFL